MKINVKMGLQNTQRSIGITNSIENTGSEKKLISAADQALDAAKKPSGHRKMHLPGVLKTENREKRVRILKELTRMDQTLNGLCRLAEDLNRCTSEAEVLHKALERATELPMVLSGWILLREGEEGFRVAAIHNLPPALEIPGAMEGDCLCRRKLLSGELDGAVNILDCARLKGIPGGKSVPVQHASIPLWVGNRTLGIMNLASEAEAFDHRDLKILYSVGHQVAVALERARLHQHLEQMVKERTHALEYKASHDSLTDLPNHTLFNDRLQQALLIARREKKPMAVLIMDLNRFKEVNNTLGHVIGDQVLKQIGCRINGVMRASDTMARLAGD
jgi:GGDEF domain-containing protein